MRPATDPPVLSLEDVTVTEGADAEFEVSLGAVLSASGTLTFEAGDRVTTEDDDLDEAASEQFKLTLSSAGERDPVRTVDVTVTEGADAEFEVSLGAESELEVTVSYATADDTNEDDYTSASGTLTFEAPAKTITVTTEDDDLDEAATTLSSAGNATLFGGQATLRSWARSKTTTTRRCCRWRT